MPKLIIRTCCLLSYFLFSGAILCAQRLKLPATLITRQNDTLKVWVISIHTHSIRVKRDSLGVVAETLPASGIRSLTASDGSRYIGAVVLIDRTPANIEVTRTMDSTMLRFEEDTVLLMAEYLSPKINLYSLADRDKLHFFVETPAVPLTELHHRPYLDRNNVQQEDLEYIRQMQAWMSDCPEVAGGLVDLPFNGVALKKAVRSYNSKCGPGTGTNYENKENRTKLDISALAGVFNPGIQVSTSAPGGSFNITRPMQSGYTFTAGLNFEYFLSGPGRKFSVEGTMLFNRANATESEYLEYGSPSAYTLQTLTVDYSSLRIDLLAVYKFPGRGNLVPFINGGLVFSSVLSSNNTIAVDEYYDNAHHVSSSDPFGTGFKRFQTGFAAGAGARYKRLGLEYRFAEILNIVFIENTNVHLSEQQVCLSFQLNR